MDGSIENTDWTTVSSYPPIAEYAFLSDCEVTALVAPSGNVEWLCLPRIDSPSAFGALLDRDAGAWHLAPVDTTATATRRYHPGSLVLETTWRTATGRVAVVDALLSSSWGPGRTLVRWVYGLEGSVELESRVDVAGDYGRIRTIVATPRGTLWVTTSNRDGRGDPAPTDDRILEIALR